ncbi:type II toxin-antitoxin system VapC family toxin [Leptolyngbya sp. AN03gr2]|uniref:type II toxin-antitoxin system VapC family toxin n=1 Tax=unclassified Leptolyngbya TaxID=2650499 RepID=UPI003D321EB7
MSSILLDTHAIVWYLRNSPKLSAVAGERIDQTIRSGDFAYLAAISLVELIYLIEKGKVTDSEFSALIDLTSSSSSGIVVASLTTEIAIALRQISRATVPELPDRIIAATALSLSLPLVTCDHKIQALTNIETVW